jgi:ferric-dicitrate binding protein FerR (iron transport regulator)
VKNNQVHRFLNKKLSREEFKDLHEKVNRDEASVLRMIEEDWDSYEFSGSWPETHWNKIEKHIKSTKEKKEPASVFRLHWFVKVAASLLFIASVWFVFKSQDAQVDEGDLPGMITHANSSNQPETVVLKDGTKVILAANSSLSYYENFNEKYRVVHLNGEAYFETNKGNIRPFIVISENITSICRSHEFSVSAFRDSEEINVVSSSGQIEIAQNDRLNSEYNKVAVESCQRYSFNKSSQQYLIGKVSDCEFDDKVRSMKNGASPKVIVML